MTKWLVETCSPISNIKLLCWRENW